MSKDPSIIQTLYLPKDIRPLANALGFLSPEFNWMSWSLSCLQLIKTYGNVELYTNHAGNHVLIEQFKLPYTKVNIVLDDIDFPPSLWVYPKLYTYSLQKKPFIHVDGDVFVWDRLRHPTALQNLIVQNIENADYYYRPVIQTLLNNDFIFPEAMEKEINKDTFFSSINAGVIGGCDIDFFGNYTSQAFAFLKNNLEKISSANPTKLNMVFEQFLFFCMAKEKNIPINCQISEPVTDMTYKNLFNFSEVPYKTKFVHMVGSYKKSIEACILLAKRLRQDYPSQYYKVIDQCKKAGITPFFNYYKNEKVSYTIPDGYKANWHVVIDWQNLYDVEAYQQTLIEMAFNNTSNLNDSSFQVNNYLIQNAEKGGNNKKNYCEVPVSFIKGYKVIELDELDNIIVELLAQPKKFKELYLTLKQFVVNEEAIMQNNVLAELIELKLLNGCVSNLYHIVK